MALVNGKGLKLSRGGGMKQRRFSIELKSYWHNLLAILVLSLGMSGIGLILGSALNFTYIKHFGGVPLVILFNTLPLALLLLLLYHLTARLWISFVIGGGLFLLLQLVNRFKMLLREEPLTPSDFLLGMEAAAVVKLSELPIGFFVVFSCVIFLLVSILLFRSVKSVQLRWPVRLIGIAACVAVFLYSYSHLYNNQKLYNSFHVHGNVYSRGDQFKSRGFMYSFLVRANTFKFSKPAGYSKEEARGLLAAWQKSQVKTTPAKLPHIIAVMGEAFYDIDRIPGVQFNEGNNPLENFNRIRKEAYSGRIITSVFGGGTANTEFAFLTGHSLPLLSEMGSPYMTYIRRDTYSLTRVLEKAGYASMAFHPGESWFYNRSNVYRFFGFDNEYFKNAMDLNKVKAYYGYISDRDTAEFMLGKFKTHLSEKPGVPFFEFVVNIENHGPYAKESLGNPEILKRPASMDPGTYHIINNYINGVSRCDKALGYLVDSLREIDEPVVFLYFSDHLPFLGENALGYKGLNFNISEKEGLEPFLNHYSTPYFIWSNEAARKLLADNKVPLLTGEAPEISVNYLPAELMDYLGMDGGAYLNFLKEARKTMPVITHRFYNEKGKYTEQLSDSSKELLEQYRRLQYYMMVEKEAVNP